MIQRITCSNILQMLNKQIKHSQSSYLLIFDLDDTIFDTSHRRYIIYENALRKRFNLPKLDLKLHENQYTFIPFLEKNLSFQENNSEIMDLYLKLFLSELYLFLDKPYNGVQFFFDQLSKFKIQVAFLTCRSELDMQKGTWTLLKKFGLIKATNYQKNLFMKKNFKISDEKFKEVELKHILDLYQYEKVIIFDNESENCRLFNESLPSDAMIIRFNSVQKKVCKYEGFLLDNWLY